MSEERFNFQNGNHELSVHISSKLKDEQDEKEKVWHFTEPKFFLCGRLNNFSHGLIQRKHILLSFS